MKLTVGLMLAVMLCGVVLGCGARIDSAGYVLLFASQR